MKNFEFEGGLLQKAIRATFANRQTVVPEKLPVALTETFTKSSDVIADWKAFIKRNKITSDTDFELLIENLREFFLPIIEAEANHTNFDKNWTASDGWTI
jgi:hypothetical protein